MAMAMAIQERSCRGFVSSRRKKYLGNFHSRIPGAMNGVVAKEYSLSLLRKPSLQPGPDNHTRKLDDIVWTGRPFRRSVDEEDLSSIAERKKF
jgi:hypothetical protein